jgi:hypothetical protein
VWLRVVSYLTVGYVLDGPSLTSADNSLRTDPHFKNSALSDATSRTHKDAGYRKAYIFVSYEKPSIEEPT